MSTLTIRLPDEKHQRLKELAASRNTSINKLVDELTTIALVEHDAKVRFMAQAACGNAQQGLVLLEMLDERDKS